MRLRIKILGVIGVILLIFGIIIAIMGAIPMMSAKRAADAEDWAGDINEGDEITLTGEITNKTEIPGVGGLYILDNKVLVASSKDLGSTGDTVLVNCEIIIDPLVNTALGLPEDTPIFEAKSIPITMPFIIFGIILMTVGIILMIVDVVKLKKAKGAAAPPGPTPTQQLSGYPSQQLNQQPLTQTAQPQITTYNCPHCGKPFTAQPSDQSQLVSCPSCWGQVTIVPQQIQVPLAPMPSPLQSQQPIQPAQQPPTQQPEPAQQPQVVAQQPLTQQTPQQPTQQPQVVAQQPLTQQTLQQPTQQPQVVAQQPLTQQPLQQPIRQPPAQQLQPAQPLISIYTCPHCGKPFISQPTAQVQLVLCSSCGRQITIGQ